jgi:hypothetical protein
MQLARNNSNGRKYSCVLSPLIVIIAPQLISRKGALLSSKLNWNMKDYIMLSIMRKVITHRTAGTALLLSLAACTSAAQAAPLVMFRDPGCGCCEKWAEHIETNMKQDIETRSSNDMGAVKDANGVPGALRSCHTMIVEGYVIEGHVPAEAIAKLLREKPAGVKGLAVAGMPVGSPGMEYQNQTQPYQVIAFGESGQHVFASYK